MLSDEEKEAIEYIKKCLDDEYDFKNATRQKDKKIHNIILNLIEKQSKEIEELKKPKYIIDCKTGEITTLTNDFVSKDKIKAKIEELEKMNIYEFETMNAIEVLQSLLEKE